MIHTNSTQSPRRQRKRAQKTEMLIDLAMSIVEKEGLNSLTMPKLADAADVAVGGLYRYFSSKEHLKSCLQVRCAEAFIDTLSEVDAAVVGSAPMDCVRAYALAWSDFAAMHPTKHALLDQSLSNPQVLLTDTDALAVDKALRPALERVVHHLKEAERREHIEPGNVWLRTYAIWAAMHGVGHFSKRDRLLPEALHSAKIRTLLLDSLFKGWAYTPNP